MLTATPAARPLNKTMSAETADNAGTPQLKQFLMVSIDMFRHPKYYKELRKLRNNLDQAISGKNSTECKTRSPGPGLKQQAPSFKRQAPSFKRQAD